MCKITIIIIGMILYMNYSVNTLFNNKKYIPKYNFNYYNLKNLIFEAQEEYGDLQAFAKKLKILSPNGTEKLFEDYYLPEYDPSAISKITQKDKCLLCCCRVTNTREYDGASVNDTLKDNRMYGYDMYRNIKITNISPKDGYVITISVNDLTIDKAEWRNNDKSYYFPLLKNNVLFNTITGNSYVINFGKNNVTVDRPTKSIITFDAIMLETRIRQICIKQNYYVIDNPDYKILYFIGYSHNWPRIVSYAEAGFDPKNPYKLICYCRCGHCHRCTYDVNSKK